MAELKAGGWALVVGGKESARLIGHTVELVSLECSNSFVRVAGQPLFFNGTSARWLIRKSGLKTALTNGSIVEGHGLVYPEHLMPIDGDDFQQEDEKRKELTNG
ncbi:hypothetical protein VRB13_15425 [Erwinia aphidicola]|uniref:hypothetical protein n=1 Tax=Erwinia aphidicola TaxID=68334 RepID=UPI0030D296C0